jgi:hypothetical protein
MFIKKEMPGLINYAGEVINNKGQGNGIFVEKMTQRRPSPRYRVACLDCGTSWTEDQHRISYLTCKNPNCGRAAQTVSSTLANTATVQEGVRSADSQSARDFHRDNDAVEDNTVPVRRTLRDGYFKPPVFTNDRDRESYRQFLREEQEAIERPIREAEAVFKRTADAVARERQKAVKEGIDPKFSLTQDEQDNIQAAKDLSLAGSDEALSFLNQAVIEKFREFGSHHDFVTSPANLDVLTSYVERNFKARGIWPVVYVPFETLVRAFAVLEHWNCFPDLVGHVYIEPEPEKENYFAAEERRRREAEAQRRDEQSRTGIDLVTGLPKTYTAREIRAMSSDQFKRCFFSKIKPTFKDLFIALSENRERR